MRHLYAPSTLVLLLSVFLGPHALAQWTTESPIPTALDVRGVGAPTPQRVFLATSDDSFDDGGALFESADGGATWTQRDVPFNLHDPLHGVFFLDSQLGWAYGNRNYRTTDGGTTWEELPVLGSTYFMAFYSPSFGFASTNGEAWISRDGGLSWEDAPHAIVAFDFADGQTGLGVSTAGLYRTADGGDTFSQVYADTVSAVTFLDATTAVAIAEDAFLRSVDGGQTWTAVGTTALGRTRLQAVTSDVVLAWGRTGPFQNYDDRVLRSADGGQSWTDLGEVIPQGVGGFAVPAVPAVVASDLQGSMHYSTDAGQTWTQSFASLGPRPTFFNGGRPAFADAQTGYFGYGNGFVIKTTDGGASWTQISSGTGSHLADVDRFADGRLITVGDNGVVLTKTGDAPWRQVAPFTSLDLVAVQAVDSERVATVDEDGLVYQSADGGASWNAAAAAPANLDASDVHFTSELDGWVIGSGAIGRALFHTTDGGATWTPVPGFGGAYVAVDIEGTHGWAANTSGRYYYSHDGGATWTQGELPTSTSQQIRDMDFADENVGYAVGWYGYAARSEDGGVSWDILPIPADTDVQLTDVYLLGPDELWVSTNDDTVYYSATGGQTWAVLEIGQGALSSFSAIAATPAGDAWVVGWQGAIEHFTGPPPPPLNRPPVASFEFEATGFTVTFTDTSTDPDGTVVDWFWDFGDSTPDSTSTEQNPTHTFVEADTYIVRLTVTDDVGATGQGGRVIVVQSGPGGTFGDFTEVTPLDPLFVTPQDEDFWVATTAPADYDGDGDLDIAVLGFYVVYGESVVERLVLLRNDGEASPEAWDFEYIDVPLGDLTTGASDLAWGDLDGDGDQDLVVGTDGETVIYRNDGGTLVATDSGLPGYYEDNDQADFDLQSITLADYDNDGDPDLLLPSVYDSGSFRHRTALLRNDGPDGAGGFTFTETDSTFAPTRHAQSLWADYDADGDLDLLLVHLAPLTPNGFIRRYRNDGGGVFVGENVLGDLTIEHGEAQWGDYDNDGDYDFLIAGNLGEKDGTFTHRALRIYENDADVFTPFDVIECIPCEGWFDFTAATWADYDSDGDIDILLTGTHNPGTGQIEGRARIYVNDNGTFTDAGDDLPAPRSSGTRGGTFSWLDIDGEGDLDYFIAGDYWVPGGNGLVEAQMHLYRYDATGSNAAPTRPSGMQATVDDETGTVTLAWNPATDDSTPASALTYDLELYRDGVPVATPRRLPEPGTIRAATEWTLSGLPEGVYTWRVRAVDTAYNGGPAAEGRFGVGVDVPSEGDAMLPLAFALEAAYPNPFREATTFGVALPAPADVELTVYDVLGRRVARLLSGLQPAGHHEVRWDAAGLPSGTYLVRLSTDAAAATRRVLLVR
ncbi:MAG: YCF48-related protein [Rhodothermales bacterium]